MRGFGIRAVILGCVLCGAVLLAGYAIFGLAGLALASALVFALGWTIYFQSERVVLTALRARPVGEVENPALYGVVRELCRDARLPVPRLFVAPVPQPNILAVGCSARSFAVCCTSGLLRSLPAAELRAVLAHELSHVSRRDTLVSSWTAGLAALVAFLPASVPLAGLLMSVITPSGRELEADFEGALLTGDPMALASALRKISASAEDLPLPARGLMSAAGPLMIAAPFPCDGRRFVTHPPMAERIRRLESLAGYPKLRSLS